MNKPVLVEVEPNTVVVEEAANAPLPLAPSYVILFALSFSHFLNDLMQSLMPAVYPLLKDSYQLDFVQIGLITMAFQFTSSIFQPLVGLYTDRRPLPWSLPIGMGSTFFGLILLANAHAYWTILVAAALVGLGSAVFHPESVRVARLASGGRHGFAQSIFQVGGNAGSAAGPLLAALIIVPWGQGSIAWFSLVAALTIAILFYISRWYKPRIRPRHAAGVGHRDRARSVEPARVLGDRHAHPHPRFEDDLCGELFQLLHVLPDPQIQRIDAERAGVPVPVPRSGRGRHPDWRPPR